MECLRRVRIGEATENDADFLQKRCCDIKDVVSLPPTTLYVASRWETVDAGNQHYLEELEKTGATIADCWAIHTLPGRPKGKKNKNV